MKDLHPELQKILPRIHSMKEIGINKGLAKFGDSITNTSYSLAKSLVIGRLDARKVNRTILSHALKEAGMKPFAKVRSDAHALADTTEAFIGYIYCSEGWSIEQISLILMEKLSLYDLNDFKTESQGATQAFLHLLLKIKDHLLPKFA
ncbi:hypothetical protein NEF87_001955 [Candidatus Lokiarchaeum ossiferum]|uniref:RNase III domain-containing protein n=1 Tax=Candidatus Lokiarchaeum ossiferum TaxID=2951803 RepID=A0ABY6HQ81_9ARCH|nr:hypothetical protein NEF87_001955 [Candidatus Lokiarchaeum sp. B-35]